MQLFSIMTRDNILRFMWLLDALSRKEKMTFSEISDAWMQSPHNPGHDVIPVRTFHNNREAILTLFGIDIACTRGRGTYYYIRDLHSPETRMRIWMLDQLCYGSSMNRIAGIKNRVSLDNSYLENYNVATFINAMKNDVTIRFDYIGENSKVSRLEREPWGISHQGDGWMVALSDNGAPPHAFRLDKMKNISLTEDNFIMPDDFNCREFFKNQYGVSQEGETARKIDIRVSCDAANVLRMSPLHDSQTEVARNDSFSIFSYRVVPSIELMLDITRIDPLAEVIRPTSYRQKVFRYFNQVAQRNTGTPSHIDRFLAREGSKSSAGNN